MDNRNKTIEEMIASGEIGTMTECAYGSAVADRECENTLNSLPIKIKEAIKENKEDNNY